ALARAICAGHDPPCAPSVMDAMDDTPAGTDDKGRELVVMVVDATEPDDADDVEDADQDTGDSDGDGDDGDEDEYRGPREHVAEYWVGVFQDGILVSHSLVTTVYFEERVEPGAKAGDNGSIEHFYLAGKEDISIEIAGNRLVEHTFGVHGGHDWSRTIARRLSPLATVF